MTNIPLNIRRYSGGRALAAQSVMPQVLLFALFALYGPAINIVGEFRYVEIVVIALFAIHLKHALRYLGKWDKRLVGLFFLTAIAYIVADWLTDASVVGTVKRVGTYTILALLLMALKWLGRGDPTRIRLMVAGYCFSYLFVFVAGIETPSRMYGEAPWRLGLGFAATIGLTLVIAWLPRLYRVGAVALLVLGAVHWLLEARSMAGITTLTGLLALWATLRTQRVPSRFRTGIVAAVCALSLVVLVGINYGLKAATEHKVFSDSMQSKMENQFASRYGLIGGGRPDTIAAIFAIAKRPLLGHGSTNVDPEVWRIYATIVAETYAREGSFRSILRRELDKEWVLGTPSHSHLLGAWADAGVFAALCWFTVLALSIYVLVRVMFWRNSAMPLITLIALATIWDVLFSPGPTRMDIAFRLLVLTAAAETLRALDLRALLTRRAG